MQVIKLVKKNEKKSIVFFDNDRHLPLYLSEIRKYDIHEDSIVDDAVFKLLNEDIILKRAKLRSMNILIHFDKTEVQLRDKLYSDGYDEFTIDDVIIYLKGYHYIDDERIARNYYEYHKSSESRMAIKRKLTVKGISQDVIETIIGEDTDCDENSIDEVIRKRRILEKCIDDNEYIRQVNYLLRKGFSYELIKKKLNKKTF